MPDREKVLVDELIETYQRQARRERDHSLPGKAVGWVHEVHERTATALVERVVERVGAVAVTLEVEDGPHAGRVRVPFDWPPTAR